MMFVDKEIINFKSVLDMIKDGKIKDSKNISLLYFVNFQKNCIFTLQKAIV
jgi:hypothetical protein